MSIVLMSINHRPGIVGRTHEKLNMVENSKTNELTATVVCGLSWIIGNDR
jgi:hypothetical protein